MEKENKKAVKVLGMTCASCARNIERTLKKQIDVSTVQVNYVTETGTLHYDKEKTDYIPEAAIAAKGNVAVNNLEPIYDGIISAPSRFDGERRRR